MAPQPLNSPLPTAHPTPAARRPAAAVLTAALALLLLACGGQPEPEPGVTFPTRDDLVENDDGLTLLETTGEPYTGPVQDISSSGVLRYFAFYRDGVLHGAEMRFDREGRLRRLNDHHDGEHVRRRDWFENGVMELDAMLKDGSAYGRHTRWFEDGSLRFFCENMMEGLRWDGRVKDIAPDGTVIFDAIFREGQFVSGISPSEELLERLHAMEQEGAEPGADEDSE